MTLDDKLCLCPKGSQKAKRVLDAGTGTGIWAMDYGEIQLHSASPCFGVCEIDTLEIVADAHPEAKVSL